MINGNLLKCWRRERKLSQAAAAKLIGVSQRFWQAMEAGERNPSTERLAVISQQTGYSTDALLGNPLQSLRKELTTMDSDSRPE